MWSEACHQVCWFWGLFEKDMGADQYQGLPVPYPQLHVWSYKLIHGLGLWLPLLGMGVHERGQIAYQGWLPWAPSLGTSQQKAQDTLRSAASYLLGCH